MSEQKIAGLPPGMPWEPPESSSPPVSEFETPASDGLLTARDLVQIRKSLTTCRHVQAQLVARLLLHAQRLEERLAEIEPE